MAVWKSAVEGMNPQKIIRLSKSCLSDAEKKAVMDVLNAGYLGMGAEVQEFEGLLTDFFGRPAVCVVNGTAALQLALQACSIGPGDEVLVQSLTYVASFQAITAAGATPVACDVNPASLTIDLHDAEKRLTKNTKAIMPVHYAGGVGKLEEVYAFANRNGLRVIEDAAHAFGTIYNHQKVGQFGDISCFSFDGIKNITSGEGGCIVTDDPAVLQKVRDSRLLGVERDTDKRFSGERSWEFDVVAQGWRYHMSNIMASIGIEQLKRFPLMAERRKYLATLYTKNLKSAEGLSFLEMDYLNVVPHIFPVLLDDSSQRNELQRSLLEKGIQTGVHYQPNHQLTFFSTQNMHKLAATERLAKSLITLPLHPELTVDDIDFVSHSLLDIISK